MRTCFEKNFGGAPLNLSRKEERLGIRIIWSFAEMCSMVDDWLELDGAPLTKLLHGRVVRGGPE